MDTLLGTSLLFFTQVVLFTPASLFHPACRRPAHFRCLDVGFSLVLRRFSFLPSASCVWLFNRDFPFTFAYFSMALSGNKPASCLLSCIVLWFHLLTFRLHFTAFLLVPFQAFRFHFVPLISYRFVDRRFRLLVWLCRALLVPASRLSSFTSSVFGCLYS